MTRRTLPSSGPLIASSMLKCDFARLGPQAAAQEAAGAPALHWDVMDGHFVPNLSYGAMVIAAIRPLTDAYFDTHLMLSDPARYVDDYLEAGTDSITFHIEAVPEPRPLLAKIRAAGAHAALALNPRRRPA